MEGPEVEKDSSVDGDGDAESETTTSTTAVKTEKYSSKNETKKPKHKPAAEPKQKREDSSRRRSGGGAAAAAAAAGSTHEEMQLSKVNQASTTRCLCRVFTYPVFSIFLFKKKKLPAVNTRAQREGNMSCRRCVHTQMQPALYLHSRSPLFSRPILCFSSPPSRISIGNLNISLQMQNPTHQIASRGFPLLPPLFLSTLPSVLP